MSSNRPRLAFLTNILAPYRLALMERLTEAFDVYVLYSGEERNRTEWTGITAASARGVHIKRSWGLVWRTMRRHDGSAFDHRFFHITPGYLLDLLRLRPAAIISGELGPRTLIALMYAALFRTRLWVFWGGTLHTERDRGSLTKLWRRVLARFIQGWLSYGETSTEYLLTLGVSRGAVVQIQNCVDEEFFSSITEPAFSLAPRPTVLCLGQLVPRKGVDRLLRACAQVQRDGIVFSLAIVGTGTAEEQLRAQAESDRVAHVHFLGGATPENLPSIYKSADLLVLPTLEDVWGLVVNEALVCGIPVLASCYAGAARELLDESWIFDPLDDSAFAGKLRCAIQALPLTADRSRVRSVGDVAHQIIDEIRTSIEAQLP